MKIQPTSQNQRENEMMTTGNAAAPQPRFASFNKMTHLKAAADQQSRTSRWVDTWRSRTVWRVFYKDEAIEYELLVPKKIWMESGATDELRYLPLPLRVFVFSWFPWPVCPPLGFPVWFVVLLRVRGFRDPNLWIHTSNSWCNWQDGTCKDSMLEQNTQKNEMEISIENCDITEWKMD